jgi:hypothetical protein
VRVMPAEEWDRAFKEAGVRVPSKKSAPAPVKSARKR